MYDPTEWAEKDRRKAVQEDLQRNPASAPRQLRWFHLVGGLVAVVIVIYLAAWMVRAFYPIGDPEPTTITTLDVAIP